MISAIVFSFDGSKSRAQVLVAAMEEYAGALERMKTDTSCYPKTLVALIDRDAAVGAAKSYCGADLSLQWNGPYVKAASTRDSSPESGSEKVILMAQLSPDLTLRIAKNDSAFGSGGSGPSTNKWFIVADGVPSEILTQALTVCNGVDTTTNNAVATAGIRKCAKAAMTDAGYAIDTLGLTTAADGTPGSMSLLFAETRK